MRGIHHVEMHKSQRNGWLRAAVLGANDGILSTASLILGARGDQARISEACWPPDWPVWLPGADVDGGRRVRFGQLSGRYRIRGPGAGTQRAQRPTPSHEQAEMAAIYVETRPGCRSGGARRPRP